MLDFCLFEKSFINSFVSHEKIIQVGAQALKPKKDKHISTIQTHLKIQFILYIFLLKLLNPSLNQQLESFN